MGPKSRKRPHQVKEAFRRQLKDHGPDSLRRSLETLERRRTEHLRKLKQYKEEGGYTSSVEREIQVFERQISAIKELLGGKP